MPLLLGQREKQAWRDGMAPSPGAAEEGARLFPIHVLLPPWGDLSAAVMPVKGLQ